MKGICSVLIFNDLSLFSNQYDCLTFSLSFSMLQIGMFSYTGLTPEQVKHCADHGSLFMLSTGRISMAGVNDSNVDHVAEAMALSIKKGKAEA